MLSIVEVASVFTSLFAEGSARIDLLLRDSFPKKQLGISMYYRGIVF
jgi:hypothetical protein